MTANRPQSLSSMSTRQKITAVVFVIILIFLIWQIWGMLRGSAPSTPAPIATPAVSGAPGAMAPQQMTPQPAQLPKAQATMTQREADLLKLQQQTEAKYIAAINELQMLKIERDIAETNKAIATAKLQTVTAEKGIFDLLKPPPPPPPVTTANYAQTLTTPTSTAPTTTPTQAPAATTPLIQQVPESPPPPEAGYVVISVSKLQNRWSAVLGFQGNLYSVYIGDFLPPDRSRVISINKSGVVLEKNGIRKKFSMVPII